MLYSCLIIIIIVCALFVFRLKVINKFKIIFQVETKFPKKYKRYSINIIICMYFILTLKYFFILFLFLSLCY